MTANRRTALFCLSSLFLAACTPMALTSGVNPASGKTPLTPATLVHDGGVVYANPYGLPTSIGLSFPTSLIDAGAGGATVIAPGGANVIAPGGANYRVETVGQSLAALVRQNAGMVVVLKVMIDKILAGVAQAQPMPGKVYSFPDTQNPGLTDTVELSVLSDHAVISIGRGTSAATASEVCAISYTSPTKGTAVVHLENDPTMGRFYLTMNWDAQAGTASADGVDDSTMLANVATPQQVAAHWDFTRPPQPTAGQPVFTMRLAGTTWKPNDSADSGSLSLSANFLIGDAAAAIVGLQTGGTNNTFRWIPADGISWANPSASHAFYLGVLGNDLPAILAPAALKAIVPSDDTIIRNFPADPHQGTPFADPRFVFPATSEATASAAPDASAAATVIASGTN